MLRPVKIGSVLLALTTGSAYAAACSNQTVEGDYTFEVHGQSLSADGSTVTGLIDGLGVATFDGNGNLTQQGVILRNGTVAPGGNPNASGFLTGQTGTYSINDDCTGASEIILGPGNTRSNAIVVTQTGQIHALVTSAEVNGTAALLQVTTMYQKITRR